MGIAEKGNLILWEKDPVDPFKEVTKGTFQHKLKVQKERDDEQQILKVPWITWSNQKFGGRYITLHKLDAVREEY